jgi:signal transduction histidine kinase/DNA-binding response OmpR family regulator
LLRALTRATALGAEGLSEERLIAQMVRAAVEAGADFAAVYVQPEQAPSLWRLAGQFGADVALPGMLSKTDLIGSAAAADAPLLARLPAQSLVRLPVCRRDDRLMAVLLVGAKRKHAFDAPALATYRGIAHVLGMSIDNARLAAGHQRERRMAVESQATLVTVLESVGNGVCVVELDGTVRVANKAFLNLFGVQRAAGIHQDEVFAAAVTRPRETEAFAARLRELIAEPSRVDESEWELATEPQRIVQRYSAPMRNVVGELVGRVDVYTDITESRRLYTQLLNSEKLRAIGEMTSGVAHDFNNLLASILGEIELLHPDELRSPTREAIETIRQSALDGARIVRNLQGLARPRAETPSTAADLNEAVLAALEMARPRWASATLHGQGAIEVVPDLADGTGLSRVAIDPAELREVLLNLLFNAADAMPDGGRIEIATRTGEIPMTADLIVRDSGHGMPESVRARIFEPFFSTKGPKGSGLGLAVAYSVITRRGGSILVDSEVDRGTTFTLMLPYIPVTTPPTVALASRPSADRPRPSPAGPSERSQLRGVRILVADDEPGLVAIVRQLMQRSGADVTVANGGKAAVEALRTQTAKFDVVITDLDMPEVDGWAVSSAVKALSPETHVVMLTGWAGDITSEDFKARGVDAMLAKPCSRADLEAVISGLLAARPASGFDVLLVDDEPAFARAVRDLLGLQGHQVTVVDSATAALEAVTAHPYDVVLTDYSLGEVSGAELAERLADRGVSSYVVLVTGYATQIDDPSLLSRGVNAVLPKPCRASDLREVMARVSQSGR